MHKIITIIPLVIFLAILSLSSQAKSEDQDIWSALQDGGKIILMRHLPVNNQGNALTRDPSCKTERNLSKAGKSKGKSIKQLIETKNIPIGEIFSSPYCRTMDTAKLIFGDAKPLDFLSLQVVLSDSETKMQIETLKKQLANYTGKKNIIFITHRPNIESISFESIEHGAFLVIEPLGNNDFDELGIINITE